MKFRVLIEQDEDGMFVATCPALPGCVSQGQTRREAKGNIAEAIVGYLGGESLKHVEDVRGIFRVSGRDLDMHYMRDWAGKLEVLDFLDMLVELEGTGPRK